MKIFTDNEIRYSFDVLLLEKVFRYHPYTRSYFSTPLIYTDIARNDALNLFRFYLNFTFGWVVWADKSRRKYNMLD